MSAESSGQSGAVLHYIAHGGTWKRVLVCRMCAMHACVAITVAETKVPRAAVYVCPSQKAFACIERVVYIKPQSEINMLLRMRREARSQSRSRRVGRATTAGVILYMYPISSACARRRGERGGSGGGYEVDLITAIVHTFNAPPKLPMQSCAACEAQAASELRCAHGDVRLASREGSLE
ncbi:hypothetical protein PYCCODRAFT_1078936 [Trametes coccinea BRFM310]|uniref:Uncharacterized protein n=1 Tax=Trametes coccinea (strain BRFM310) TaxID=1353009 RepID=A0A1Y2IZL5_TRAC3|nr:hypothetical protein PYCCODRAFT_1078936 [Trametes coccinea BRFM310]